MKKAGWPARKDFGLFQPLSGAIWCPAHSLFLSRSLTHTHPRVTAAWTRRCIILSPSWLHSFSPSFHIRHSLCTQTPSLSLYHPLNHLLSPLFPSLTDTYHNLHSLFLSLSLLSFCLPPFLRLPLFVPEEPAPMHILAPLLSSSLLCLSPVPHK